MENQQIKDLFIKFLNEFNEEKENSAWVQISTEFRNFWNNVIIDPKYGELNDSELDDIIRYLDHNAKGNTKDTISVAKAMISQGMWRRMFNDIHKIDDLRENMNKLFSSQDDSWRVKCINEIYKINKNNKNSLTGKVGNAINAMLFAFNPRDYISIISLNHRRKVIEYFNFNEGPDFDTEDQGSLVVKSNAAIIKGFREIGIENTPRIISEFLYSSYIKDHWIKDQDIISDVVPPSSSSENQDREALNRGQNIDDSLSLFYMEKHLEDFIIENWEKSEFGEKYDLIEKDGEIISQQYPTKIGPIDILAIDKKTGQYVVIELKKNQTSDDTVGQIARYMGWLEEQVTNGKSAKGIIIASKYDKRLFYALKKIKDVEVYLYRVDFKLKEFKE